MAKSTNTSLTETLDLLREMDSLFVSGTSAIGAPQTDEALSFWTIHPVDPTDLEGTVEATYFNRVEGAEIITRQFPSFGHMVMELGLSEQAASSAATYWADLTDKES